MDVYRATSADLDRMEQVVRAGLPAMQVSIDLSRSVLPPGTRDATVEVKRGGFGFADLSVSIGGSLRVRTALIVNDDEVYVSTPREGDTFTTAAYIVGVGALMRLQGAGLVEYHPVNG